MSDQREGSSGGLPAGLERVLALAASDPELSRALLEAEREARARIAREGGVALSPSEEAVLRAIPAEQLRLMIHRLGSIPPAPVGPRPFAMLPAGIRPDLDGPSRGLRPGLGAARGVLVASAVATGAMATYWAVKRAGEQRQGAVLVAVPQVLGLDLDMARRRIEAAGLKVGEVRGEAARAAGVVEASAPAPGTPVERGAAVGLTIRPPH